MKNEVWVVIGHMYNDPSTILGVFDNPFDADSCKQNSESMNDTVYYSIDIEKIKVNTNL